MGENGNSLAENLASRRLIQEFVRESIPRHFLKMERVFEVDRGKVYEDALKESESLIEEVTSIDAMVDGEEKSQLIKDSGDEHVGRAMSAIERIDSVGSAHDGCCDSRVVIISLACLLVLGRIEDCRKTARLFRAAAEKFLSQIGEQHGHKRAYVMNMQTRLNTLLREVEMIVDGEEFGANGLIAAMLKGIEAEVAEIRNGTKSLLNNFLTDVRST